MKRKLNSALFFCLVFLLATVVLSSTVVAVEKDIEVRTTAEDTLQEEEKETLEEELSEEIDSESNESKESESVEETDEAVSALEIEVTGVENGQVYTAAVVPDWICKEGLTEEVILVKDGEKISDYEKGMEISEPGHYELTVEITGEEAGITCDKTVVFTIEEVKEEEPEEKKEPRERDETKDDDQEENEEDKAQEELKSAKSEEKVLETEKKIQKEIEVEKEMEKDTDTKEEENSKRFIEKVHDYLMDIAESPRDAAIIGETNAFFEKAAYLRNINVSEGELYPSFNADNINYILELPPGKNSTKITPVLADDKQKLEVEINEKKIPGPPYEVKIDKEKKFVVITVSSEEHDANSYAIAVVSSGYAALEHLSISEGELFPELSFDVLDYTVEVGCKTNNIRLHPEVLDKSGQKIEVLFYKGCGKNEEIEIYEIDPPYDIELGEGKNVIEITVTSKHETTTKKYTIDIVREELVLQPTNPSVDSENGTFSWTCIEGFEQVSDYEYSVDNGVSWKNCSDNYIVVPNKDIPAGHVQVRLKAGVAEGHSEPGIPLKSDKPYIYDDTNPQEPIVYGVKDGEIYNDESEVWISWETFNGKEIPGIQITATLAKDGKEPVDIHHLTKITENGHYVLSITKKKLRNSKTTTKVINFIVDKVAPEPPIVTGVENGRIYGQEVSVNWQQVEGVTTTATLNGSKYEKNMPIIKDGKYILIVTAERNNSLKAEKVIRFDINKQPPEKVEIFGIENCSTYKRAVATWNDVEDVTITAFLSKDDNEEVPYTKGEEITDNGEYVLKVVATKENGLKAENKVLFSINNEAPEQPVFSGVGDGGIYTKGVTPTWTIPEGTTVTATLNGEKFAQGETISKDGEYALTLITTSTENTELTSAKTIYFSIDTICPKVISPQQTPTDEQKVYVASNEGSGYVYIIQEGVNPTNVADLDNAVQTNKGAKTPVQAVNQYVAVSTKGLEAGAYYAYAADQAKHISLRSDNEIIIGTDNQPYRHASSTSVDLDCADADGKDEAELSVCLFDDKGIPVTESSWIYVASNRGNADIIDTDDDSICVRGEYVTAILVKGGECDFTVKSATPGTAKIAVGLNEKVYDYIIGDIGDEDTNGSDCLLIGTSEIIFTTSCSTTYLSDLYLDKGIMLSNFKWDLTIYRVNIPSDEKSIKLTPVKANDEQTVVVKANGKVIKESPDNTYSIVLNEGNNIIKVEVTAVKGEDETLTNTYVIKAYRGQLEEYTDLSDIKLSSGTLKPAFQGDKLAYKVAVDNNVKDITITPVKGYEKQTLAVKANGKVLTPPFKVSLNEGDNPIEIKVISEDKKVTKIYTVIINRAKPSSGKPSSGSSGSSGGGGGFLPEEPSEPVLENLRTADDKAIDKSLQKAGYARLDLRKDKDSQAEVSTGVIHQLYNKKKPLIISNSGVDVKFATNSLLTPEVREAMTQSGTVRISVQDLDPAERAGVLASASLGANTGIFEIGGSIYNLTAEVAVSYDKATKIKNFTEPVAITVKVGNNLTPEQIKELCGIRFEKDETGRIIPVKLGGQYDSEKQTFTFLTDSFSLYSVMRVKNLSNIKLTLGTLVADVNGEYKTIDAAPKLVNSRTMVPLRVIGEALGAEFAWDGATKTVTFKLDSKELKLTVGESTEEMDTPPVIIEGRTLVPVRYIGEAFGADVTWFKSTQTVQIVK